MPACNMLQLHKQTALGPWHGTLKLLLTPPQFRFLVSPQAHYVERLAVLYFHNASTVVQQLYRLVSSFIDPATREKIVFLPHDPQESAAILEKDIDLAVSWACC